MTHLLHDGSTVGVGSLFGTFAEHLVLGIDIHGDLQETLVQEWDSSLEAPSHGRLVGSQTICRMQVLDSFYTLLVEVLGVGSGVEVEVTTENLVGTFTTQHHLDSHSFDLSRQEVHGGRSSNSGDIIGFEVVNDLWNGIESFLDSKVVFVVNGSEEVGGLLGGDQVGSAGKTNSKGM